MEVSSVQMRACVGQLHGIAGGNPFLRRHSRLLPNWIKIGSFAPRRRGIFMQLENSSSTGNSGFDANTSIKYSDFKSGQPIIDNLTKPSPNFKPVEGTPSTNGSKHEEGIVEQPKKSAKIHDFCFGIPFGGFVFGGGLVGFIFTRNLSILSTGILFGGALLALSTCSLKFWRQGKSSLPFILGQTAIASVLIGKNFQTYSLTKKLFPTGLYALFSAAMLCFYMYVMLSGGNPPPKKSKMVAELSAS